MLSLFSSESEENPVGLKNSSYDSLLAQAASTTGEESLSAMMQAEKYLNDAAIFYPLYYTDRYYLTGKTVSGVVIHPCGAGFDFILAGKEE